MLFAPLPPTMLTSYVRGGGGATRVRGMIPEESQLLTAGRAGGAFSAAPRAVKVLEHVDKTVQRMGGRPLRITEARRETEVQRKGREAYDRWLAAGKPAPGGPGFDPRTMKAAFVARPGESFHECGLAFDLDVEALDFGPGAGQRTDAALAMLWRIARPVGMEPIIGAPLIHQSESWHFDVLPECLHRVRRMFDAHAAELPRYARSYTLTARVANLVAGTVPFLERLPIRVIQAKLLLAGHWCGEPDGYLGPKTSAALAAAGIPGVNRATPFPVLKAAVADAGIGDAEMREF